MTHAKDASSSDEEYNSNNNHCKNANQTRMECINADAKPRKGEKSFEELVEESLRLPDISPSSRLPMSMTEILRRSQTQTNATANLPQIRRGQVQLVGSDAGWASERKRRLPEKKAKFGRPKRPSPRQQQPSSSEHSEFSSDPAGGYSSRDGSTVKPEQAKWKKKLHRRPQGKRRPMAPDVDPLNVSGDFRLPSLQGVQKIKQRCIERWSCGNDQPWHGRNMYQYLNEISLILVW